MTHDGSQDRGSLRADCARCFGLCCVAPAFSASVDFAIDKPAGQPCLNLQPDFRCGIHGELRSNGFRGCTVYDCFGAGQHVSQVTFGGRGWREAPQTGPQMYGVFAVVRGLHELLWYLTSALELPGAAAVHDDLRLALEATQKLTDGAPEALLALDLDAHRHPINALLLRASELVRAEVAGHTIERRGADLAGANLAGADLRGANLRGTRLIGADLRRADLGLADLTGADLRDADLRGASLTVALFLTQSQLDAATGDTTTGLPQSLSRPPHWR